MVLLFGKFILKKNFTSTFILPYEAGIKGWRDLLLAVHETQ